MKKATIILLALLVCALPAFAESGVYAGEVVATEEVNVLAPCDGTIADYAASAGERINEGDLVARYQTDKVYATADGTVAAVWAGEGEEIDGTLIEVEPIGKYTIYCTVDGGYESVDTYFVHAGETVYIKCTEDGTHRGTGTITSVDGEDYMVTTTGGEFYVGETVYLYRDASFTYSDRIGIGTLIYSDNTQYDADGTVIKMHVAVGDQVERGQLLYETLGTTATDVTASISGIVASVGGAAESSTDTTTSQDATETTTSQDATETATAQSDASAAQSTDTATTTQSASGTNDDATYNAVSEGDVLAVIYPYDGIMIEISVPEDSLKAISIGQAVGVVFADDPDDTYSGVVERIANIAEEDGSYRALVSVNRENLSIGMTCDVVMD